MPIDVSPTSKTPTHHISLKDANNVEYGLVLTPNGNAIQRRPKQNSQYVPFTQNDWSGGRGLRNATDDRSRFADSKRLNTRRPGMITMGGLETYTSGHRQVEQYMPADASGVTWKSLLTADRYIGYKVAAGASGNRFRIYLWIRRRGTPTSTLTVELCSDNAGSPGTVRKTVTVTTTDITDTISELVEFTFSSVYAVTSSTNYWVKVYTSTADSADNYWQVGVDSAGTPNKTKSSSDGSSWSDVAYDLYFRLVDDADIAGVMFFQYRSQLYVLTRPHASAAPKLYMNGYRGVATGTQTRAQLQDTTVTFPVNGLVGKLLLIIDGANSEWSQPYKTILSNTDHEIITDPFGAAHVSLNTTYVILGTDVWTEITGHGLTVLPTSIVSTGDVCYFAQGDAVTMRKMYEKRSAAGVWTRAFSEEFNYAKLLMTYRDPTNGVMVMKANDYDNGGKPSVASAKAESWPSRLEFPLLLDSCSSTTGWTFSSNVSGAVGSSLTTGTSVISMTVGGSAPELIGYRTLTGLTLQDNKKIRMWVYSSETLEPGALKLRLSAASDCSTSVQDVDFPALTALEWTQVELPYKDSGAGITTVVTIGFLKTAHSGVIQVGLIEAMPSGSEIPLGNDMERITGLELYGDPEVPWVFRSGSVGSIENGTFNPVPLREYSQVENIHNGVGHVVHDVFLYFSFQQGLEEYYRSNLDDVGPNKDEGMPAGRQGYITSMLGYPDRFLYNIDAGDDGCSAIMTRKGGGHHEDFRCDTAGKRIRAIFLQVIPGDMADRLWFSEGEDIGYLPMPGNTVNELTDTTYRFTHEGVLELAWIGDDQQRIFSSVKLGTENLSATRCIEWDCKLDEETSWTPMSTPFTSGPVQSLTLNKTGKRLKLRFRMQTNSNTSTPRITTINIGTTVQPDVHYSYSMTFNYMDNMRNLLNEQDTYLRAEQLIAQLDTWVINKTPLTMRSISETFDSKTVILDPVVLNPLGTVQPEQQEKLSATLVAVEPS